MPAQGILTATAAALLLALPASAAAAPLPVGEAHGVRLQQGRDGLAVVFTKRAARLYGQIAGKRIEISCVQLPKGDRRGMTANGGAGMMMRAPRQRRPLRPRMLSSAGNDYCTVSRRYEDRTSLLFDQVVAIPVTQAGAIALDERAKAGRLIALLAIVGEMADQRRPAAYPMPAELTGRAAKWFRGSGLSLVSLDSADATPPAGRFGYWSDGADRAAAVTPSASGRRLYVEVGPDGELRTNVAAALLNEDD